MNTAVANETANHREIWLIRHGETEWSLNGRHTGRTDIPLTGHGREQARALVPLLQAVHFDTVLSSPRTRALDTCKLAGLGERVEVEPDLREWDYGIYEGRTTHEIRDSVPDWAVWHSPIPQGESAEQVQARAMALIDRLLAMPGRIALFSHSHFLRSLAGCWVANSVKFGAHLYLDTASVSILGFERDTRAIRQWNRLPSLPG
ncbi:histidine phosphatase family protein [Paraburkholderia rhizosphaerae]|uniref:Putative phosphoglycerate mutase n=1 Tax=Paraburkholderia rhizosphaerae TaxID=480658 RepID=A0A4R8LII8_9BURK|nr:histidine phosphatase family protein [Paraburkholderia rhizosphaerae]TDY42238.1 putative phosphoglycerate mutase [Paraburkholderia rhizosphaerae]